MGETDISDIKEPAREVLPKGRRDWATLIANMGVVIGLLLLTFELFMGRVSTAVSMEMERTSKQQDLFLIQANPVVRDAYVKSIREPDALTDEDIIVLDGFLAAYTQQWAKINTLMIVGLADEDRLRQSVEANANYIFGTPFGQEWWKREQLTWGRDSDLYRVADEVIRDIDPNWMADRLDALAETTRQDVVSAP